MENISIDDLPIGVFSVNPNQSLIYVNKYFCEILGYKKDKLLGPDWVNYIHPDDLQDVKRTFIESMSKNHSFEIEFRFKHHDDNDLWVICRALREKNIGIIVNYVGTITDITELKKSQADLKKLARFDPLTQLPNRYLFEEMMTKSLVRAKRNQNKLALFYIDIDFFKNVNDFYGHLVGDKFLFEAGRRLRNSLRSEDFIARLGGDEFAIILEDINNTSTISLTAVRIIADFQQPFIIENHEILSSMSIGISVYPDELTTTETILQHADDALYQAKEAGRNCFRYYNKSTQKRLDRYMLIMNSLRNANENNEFELYYQPKVNGETKQIVGIEALLRWNNPLVNSSPAEFINVAEETGLMDNIGTWVISEALTQYKKWYDSFSIVKNIKISINISTSQLNSSRIIEDVSHVLKETDLPTQNILFELTETAVMKKTIDSKSVLHIFLEELGIGISIDDFGTGYSSLTYLKQLPIKELKIDKSFIDDIGKSKNNEAIIIAIIKLANALELEVIAEGVENKEQMEFLSKNGCFVIQGYYFSKPLSAADMTKYINTMSIK